MDNEYKAELRKEWEQGYSLDGGGHEVETAESESHGTVVLIDGGLAGDMGLCDLERMDGRARDRSCVDLFVVDTDSTPPEHLHITGHYGTSFYSHVTVPYQLYETDHTCWACDGTGEYDGAACPRCGDGEGFVMSPGGYLRGYADVTREVESVPVLWTLLMLAGLHTGESFTADVPHTDTGNS